MMFRTHPFSASARSLVAASVLLATVCVPAAFGHGAASDSYEATITSVKPKGIPIDVRVVDGDKLRVENVGTGDLLLCGYGTADDKGCEPFVRIQPDGVDVNHNTRSYYANLDTKDYGEVPDDVGAGGPKWVRLRSEPAFYAYHDHRVHWMGGETLPPGVDSGDPDRQLVNDFTVTAKYNDTPVTISGRLDYVGGQTWFQRYGEVLITGLAVLIMLVVFGFDARRRRRARRRAAGTDDAPPPSPPRNDGPGDGPTQTVLLPEREQQEPV